MSHQSLDMHNDSFNFQVASSRRQLWFRAVWALQSMLRAFIFSLSHSPTNFELPLSWKRPLFQLLRLPIQIPILLQQVVAFQQRSYYQYPSTVSPQPPNPPYLVAPPPSYLFAVMILWSLCNAHITTESDRTCSCTHVPNRIRTGPPDKHMIPVFLLNIVETLYFLVQRCKQPLKN